MKVKRVTALVLALGCGNLVVAQDLNLFEPVEKAPLSPRQVRPATSHNNAENGTPAFTLRGFSRFGDGYQGILADKNGKEIEVHWKPGEKVQLPGHFGYAVIDINAHSLSLAQPDGVKCLADQDAGVACADDNVAVLTLATLSPLPEPATGKKAAAATGPEQSANGGDRQPRVFTNPFTGEQQVAPQLSDAELAARAERQRARAQRLQQLQVNRIDDSDVPPGMRVVRTPFGDRLVPDNQ